MPDRVEPEGFRSHDPGMEARVAVLESIAQTTASAIERLDRSMERLERRMDALAAEQRTDFRWLLGIMLGGFVTMLGAMAGLLAAMAHGFHWL